jgi:poly(A) polymerase
MSHEPVRYADTLIFPAALDPDAVATVRRLIDAGLQSYLVGGCVRDLLLGLIPKDFDVSTEARPRQIRRLFRNSRIIGRRFKLAHIHWPGGKIIEVATFRRTPEGSGEPGVESDLLITRDNEFGNAEEDVLRRDFTINALLYDVRTAEVIDYVGGVQDLKDRLLRTIGDPATRFAEDPVRMLRAMKFLARLQLQPTPEVAAAMSASSELIARSSPARVLEEIYKLMACGKAERALPLLVEHGLLQRLLPEVAPYWAEHLDQFAAVGAALDRVDRGRRRVGNDQLLAVLCLGPWLARADQTAHDPLLVAHDLFDHAALRMSIPRRDMAALRQVLVSLGRLVHPRRSRRFSVSDFLRRPAARQGIELLYIAAQAGLVDPELHAQWAQRLATQPAEAAGHAPQEDDELGTGDSEEPRQGGRRRRRRGGRNRRRGGGRGFDAPEGERPFGPQQQFEGEAGAEPALEPDADAAGAYAGEPDSNGAHPQSDAPPGEGQGEGRRRGRRRRGRRGRGRGRGHEGEGGGMPAPGAAGAPTDAASPSEAPVAAAAEAGGPSSAGPQQERGPDGGGRRGRRRRRGGRGRNQGQQGQQGQPAQPAQQGQPRQQQQKQQAQGQPRGGRGRGRGQRREGAPREQRRDGAPKEDSGPAQGPGQRHPEDVEDFFDW